VIEAADLVCVLLKRNDPWYMPSSVVRAKVCARVCGGLLKHSRSALETEPGSSVKEGDSPPRDEGENTCV
jgi:hypothetical protein